jgi:hypothetical protein
MVRFAGSNSITRCAIRQFLVILLTLILLSTTNVAGQKKFEKLNDNISYPGNIPNFTDFETPTIVPGSTEELKFSITNRYNFTDNNNMSNVILTVNIYRYTTLEKDKKIEDISNSPEIVGGNEALQSITDKWTAVYFWSNIQRFETKPVVVSIKSKTDTPEGRYFVRTQLNFSFDNSHFEMRSRGHFSDSKWDKASMNISDQEGDGIFGRLDLNKLKVSGIIPETSIRVLTPIPIWPLFVIIGFAVLCIILAIVFYLMDEKGKFPNLKKKLDNASNKINDIRFGRRK